MRVTVKLEGKTITHKEAKEILGEERFERYNLKRKPDFGKTRWSARTSSRRRA